MPHKQTTRRARVAAAGLILARVWNSPLPRNNASLLQKVQSAFIKKRGRITAEHARIVAELAFGFGGAL